MKISTEIRKIQKLVIKTCEKVNFRKDQNNHSQWMNKDVLRETEDKKGETFKGK